MGATALSAAVPPPAVEPGLAAEITVQPQPVGTISKYLFGANLLWAYNEEGAFDPTTDAFYPAFVSSLRRLGITSLRYPGGTASDSFDWLRAVGPKTERLANEPYGMQYTRVSRILLRPGRAGCIVSRAGRVRAAAGPSRCDRQRRRELRHRHNPGSGRFRRLYDRTSKPAALIQPG